MKEYKLTEEVVKKHIQNWRDYSKKKIRDAKKGYASTSSEQKQKLSNSSDQSSSKDLQCKDCGIELTGQLGIHYFRKFDTDIY